MPASRCGSAGLLGLACASSYDHARVMVTVAQRRTEDKADVDERPPVNPDVVAAAEAVAVQPGAEDEVDAIPGHDDGGEANHRAGGEPKVLHPADVASVQRD